MGVTTAFQRRRAEAMAEWGLTDASDVLYTCPETGWTLARPRTLGDIHILGALLDNCLENVRLAHLFDLPANVTWCQVRALGRSCAFSGVWDDERVVHRDLYAVRDENGHPQIVLTLSKGCPMLINGRANSRPEREPLLVMVAGARGLGWNEQALELVESMYRLDREPVAAAA